MPTLFRLPYVLTCLIALSSLHAVSANDEIPKQAGQWKALSSKGVTAHVEGKKVWLNLDPSIVQAGKAVIPRLCAPVRSIRWIDEGGGDLKFRPETQTWVFSWSKRIAKSRVVEITFDTKPLLPADCPPAKPAGDGSVMLQAYQARTFGEKLRFEPQWYKNTVGYWAVGSDYVTWKLSIDQPGTFSVAVLQGCGKGHGGSDAVISLRQGKKVQSELPFRTIDTGHFQNFRWNHLGMINVKSAGSYELRIDAKRIAKGALFDVRMIHLVRQATPPK